MSRFRRIEIVEPHYPPFFVKETSIFTPKTLPFPSFVVEELDDDLGLVLDPFSSRSDPFELFETVTDLIEVERTSSLQSYKRIQQRVGTELALQSLCDQVSSLESRFDRLVHAKVPGARERKYSWTAEIKGPEEREYKWTAEIRGPLERKYKWSAEIKDGKHKKAEEKKYKWTAEIERKEDDELPVSRKYTFEAISKPDKKEEKEEKKKKEEANVKIVQIEVPSDQGTLLLRDAFAKRVGAVRNRKGKAKELSPQDAALLIQITFRAYLIRRSQALRALRELAVAKAKLKEIRALFNNFSYRRQVARDAEERQRFSEKIIVLLLTVDAIEGADLMVRAAKRSMVDELEAMLDVVDPQPPGQSLSMRRRTFDMPDGVIRKEIAEGVAQVVKILDQEGRSSETFEACL